MLQASKYEPCILPEFRWSLFLVSGRKSSFTNDTPNLRSILVRRGLFTFCGMTTYLWPSTSLQIKYLWGKSKMRIICGRRGSGVGATEKGHGTGGLLFYASIPRRKPRPQLLLYLKNSHGVVHLTSKIFSLSLYKTRSHNTSRATWLAINTCEIPIPLDL